MLKLLVVESVADACFAELVALYERSFPRHERREIVALIRVLGRDFMTLYQLRFNDVFAGVLILWRFGSFRYVEHFAIAEQFRSAGLGAELMNQILEEDSGPVLLEVEPDVDEMSVRRIGFYERLGFHRNDHAYTQPPYRRGELGTELLIMSYPRQLSAEVFEDFIEVVKEEVYRKWQ